METTTDATRRRDVADFVASPFYDHWRVKVEATGGCLNPIRLSGRYAITDALGRTLHDHSGQVMVACGTRRAALCPACSHRYAADAFHLIRAGLSGDDAKGIPATVAHHPRVFATLTAPSFGAIHTRRMSARGFVVPCACGDKHSSEADTRPGTAIDPNAYDYEAAVLWNAHAGALWHRWCIAVRRKLATAAGIRTRDLGAHATLSYSKVAEYQRRGLIHFHAAVRIDGPHGPNSPAPAWATPELLAEAVRHAATVTMDTHRPDGEVLTIAWGEQLDVRSITTTDDDGGDGISEAALAGYVAKYVTKSTGATEAGIDRRIRSRQHIELLTVHAHFKQMMLTAWDLAETTGYEDLNLRRRAHMLGFSGHFLTKSKVYSTTFKRLRAARQLHRFTELLAELGTDADNVVVINHWDFTGVGHSNAIERELAEAIAHQQLTTKETHVPNQNPQPQRP